MFWRRITLFKLLGFEVRLDASWLVIAALIVWSLAVGFFPYRFRGLSTGTYWWMGIWGAVGLFASIIFHEFFHSIVARRSGLQMKGITLFIFGGIAEMEEEPPSAKVEFLMAIAGPLSSIGLGFIFEAVYLAGRSAWPVSVTGVIAYLAWINWILAAFNLIPAFPLDGGRVLRAALWHWKKNLQQATRVASFIGTGFGVFLMVAGVFELFVGNIIGAIWWFLIGMFLQSASKMSYQQVLVREALTGVKVGRFMKTDPITVGADTSLLDLVDNYVYRYHHKMFPVVTDPASRELFGCVTIEQVKGVPQSDWAHVRVRDIAQRCSDANTVAVDTDASKVLSLLGSGANSRLLVLEGNRLAGIVSSRDLVNFLSIRLKLGEGDAGRLQLPPSDGKAAA